MLSKYKWLNAATAKIRFVPDRKAVQQELSEHITDLQERYIEKGMDEESAESAALQAMGSPEAIAADLGRIHRPWLGYLWWASKALLIAAIGVCIILSVMQVFRNPGQIPLEYLPGRELYDYLTWKFEIVYGETEQYELFPTGTASTGGYTIRTTQAFLRQTGDPEGEAQRWNLLLCFHIDTGWRSEALRWGSDVITEIRDDSGNTYDSRNDGPEKYYCAGSSAAAPLLGQKAALRLNDVPEDMEWIELTIGYGTLRRTMHIDLKEAAS